MNEITIGSSYEHQDRLYHVVQIISDRDDVLVTKYYNNLNQKWVYGITTRSMLELGISTGGFKIHTNPPQAQTELQMTWTEPVNAEYRDQYCRNCKHCSKEKTQKLSRFNKTIHVCGLRVSGRTECKRLKIKLNQPACYYFQAKRKEAKQ